MLNKSSGLSLLEKVTLLELMLIFMLANCTLHFVYYDRI